MNNEIGMERLQQPAFIIIEQVIKNNISNIVQKTNKNGVVFRPHFKTHQSAGIGVWFRNEGIDKITVSSVSMASYFADVGWKDILIAFPVNINEINEINNLAAKIKLSLLVDSIDSIHFLNRNLKKQINVFLKIDTGYGRAGIMFDNYSEIQTLVRAMLESSKIKFAGLLSHYGQTYNAQNRDEVLSIYNNCTQKMTAAKNYIKNTFNVESFISIGDTPSCSVVDNFCGVDEIRPGNFVFYDLMQLQLGVCSTADIGGFVACPVVSVYPDRSQVLIYGGAVHFSKEFIIQNSGQKIFGYNVVLNRNGYLQINDKIKITGLSQEHGIVTFEEELPENLNIGNTLLFVPVHSCLAANLHPGYFNTKCDFIKKMNNQSFKL